MKWLPVVMTIVIACGRKNEPPQSSGPTEVEAVRFYKTVEPELRAFERAIGDVLGDHPYRCGQINDMETLSTLIATLAAWVPAHQPKSVTWLEIDFDCGGVADQSLYASTWVGGRPGQDVPQGGDVKLSWGIFAAPKSSMTGIRAVSRGIKTPEKVRVSAYYAMP